MTEATFWPASSPETERPREKLKERGVTALSDEELLALLIGSGTASSPLKSIVRSIITLIEEQQKIPSLETLSRIKGIGPAKASLITASLELMKRWSLNGTRRRIQSPKDIFFLVSFMGTRKKQEVFVVITLNGANDVIKIHKVSVGLLNRTLIHPREVFAPAVRDRAAAVILSGNINPSPEDKKVTARISRAGEILGIPVLDHLIFTETEYYSFVQEGLL